MKINRFQTHKKDNNVSFGWLPKTHSYITKSAINKIPELLPYKKYLQMGSVIPDIRLSQTSLLGSEAHYWYGKDFNCYDTVPKNAADFYCVLLSKAFEYLAQGHKKLAMYKAGETLHFLQDMAVPMHTKKECHGFLNIFKHLNYERLANKNFDLIDNLSLATQNSEPENIYKLFIDAHKKSSSMKNPFDKDVNMKDLIKTTLTNAYVASYKFLKRFSDISKMSSSKRQECIAEEIFLKRLT